MHQHRRRRLNDAPCELPTVIDHFGIPYIDSVTQIIAHKQTTSLGNVVAQFPLPTVSEMHQWWANVRWRVDRHGFIVCRYHRYMWTLPDREGSEMIEIPFPLPYFPIDRPASELLQIQNDIRIGLFPEDAYRVSRHSPYDRQYVGYPKHCPYIPQRWLPRNLFATEEGYLAQRHDRPRLPPPRIGGFYDLRGPMDRFANADALDFLMPG